MRDAGPLQGKQILIAEDNSFIAIDLHAMVEARDGAAFVAASNNDALAMLQHNRIDAAIVDAKLLDGDARPLALELSGRAVPFVVVSGYAPELLSPALRAAPFLAKPYQQAELLELVGRMLAGEPPSENLTAGNV